MRSLLLLSLIVLSFTGNTQVQYDSLFALNLKKEVKGLKLEEDSILWFYTYHQVHEFDLNTRSDIIYPVEDDTVYQYLFDNALRNSDYTTTISPEGKSIIYIVDKRNIFWFVRKDTKYVLFTHLEIMDQFAHDYSRALFMDEDKILTGGKNGNLVTYTRLKKEVKADTISMGTNGAIYSLDASGDLLSIGTGASSYLTYSFSKDSVLNEVSLSKFQKYCDGYWCTQIPKKIEYIPGQERMVAMISNKVNAIITSHVMGKFSPVYGTQPFTALDFSVSKEHLFILDEQNIIHILDFKRNPIGEINPWKDRFNPYKMITVSKDGTFLIRYDRFGHIEVFTRNDSSKGN